MIMSGEQVGISKNVVVTCSYHSL